MWAEYLKLVNSQAMPYFNQYIPAAGLENLVREIHVFRVEWPELPNPQLPPPYITCLANTEQNLYFFPYDPVQTVSESGTVTPAPPLIVTGPKDRPVGLKFGRNHLLIKVAFYPTGMYRLLGCDMTKTVNQGLNAVDFWGEEVNALLCEIRQSAGFDQMIDKISSFLLSKLELACRPEEPIDVVAREMLNPACQYSLEEWAARACLSLRQFERNFTSRVGLPPKLFLRIVRFEQAMKLKNERPTASWSEIALECAYTDSSHLLKDFRSFAEFPPGKLYGDPNSGNGVYPTG